MFVGVLPGAIQGATCHFWSPSWIGTGLLEGLSFPIVSTCPVQSIRMDILWVPSTKELWRTGPEDEPRLPQHPSYWTFSLWRSGSEPYKLFMRAKDLSLWLSLRPGVSAERQFLAILVIMEYHVFLTPTYFIIVIIVFIFDIYLIHHTCLERQLHKLE